MQPFRQFVSESGDSSYPYDYRGIEHNVVHQYQIHHPTGKKFKVSIFHDMPGNNASVEFGDESKAVGADVQVTHEHPRDSHKILSTVHKIMKDHSYEHGINTYHFTSDKSEKSRVSLYTKFTKRFGGKTVESPNRNFFHHKIPTDNL